MSQKNTYPITCPECRREQDVELYESINAREDPDLREALLANRINQVVCSGCGSGFRVDKSLLYSDPERRYMIYCVPEQGQDMDLITEMIQEALKGFSDTLPEGIHPPTIHLTRTHTALIEKIFMLEADFDPRIIEYIKYTIYTRNLDTVPPESKHLLLDVQDSTEDHLFFVVQDVQTLQLEQVLQYSRQGYLALCEMFDQDSETADLMELFPGPEISARKAILFENEEILESDEED